MKKTFTYTTFILASTAVIIAFLFLSPQVQATNLFLSTVGTSTMPGGLNMGTGCYAIGGTCLTLASFSGTLPIANGGTATTTGGNTNGIEVFNGTRITNYSGYTLTSSLFTATNASTTALSINGDTATGKRYLTFTYATSTTWTGTTTLLQLGIAPIGFTFSAAQCATDAGTLNVQYQYGTGPTLVLPTIPASTTVGTVNFTSNNTPVSPNVIGVKAGTPASSPTTVTCTVTAKQT